MSIKGVGCRTKRDPIESRAKAAVIVSRVLKGASAEQTGESRRNKGLQCFSCEGAIGVRAFKAPGVRRFSVRSCRSPIALAYWVEFGMAVRGHSSSTFAGMRLSLSRLAHEQCQPL